MGIEQIVAAVKAWAAGEGLSMEDASRRIAAGLLGEGDVALLRAPAGFRMLALKARSGTGPAGRGAAATLTAEERDLVVRCKMDPERIAEGLAQEAEERARKHRDAPLILSDSDRAELRRRGYSVELLERMNTVTSIEDYRKARRDLGLDGGGAA